jgi:hypothetical protein
LPSSARDKNADSQMPDPTRKKQLMWIVAVLTPEPTYGRIKQEANASIQNLSLFQSVR